MMGFFRCYRYGVKFSRISPAAKVARRPFDNYARASLHQCCSVCASVILCKTPFSPIHKGFATDVRSGNSWEVPLRDTLLIKLDIALKNDSVHEAWEAFNNFKCLHGFPKQDFVSRMIILLSCSPDTHWLSKAYDMVLVVLNEKPGLLHNGPLTRLALTLARSQMPIPASTILRIILDKGKSPPVDVWSILVSHLVKAQIGSYLACDILIEICECLVCNNLGTKGSKNTKLLKPNTTMFNLVLDSCLRYGSILKAQQIIELMPVAGVVADANSVILIARVFEMTGQCDELKRLKRYIDGVSSVLLNRHYKQFYDSLLSLHFKYNDIDAALELVLDLYQHPKPLQSSNILFTNSNGLQKHCAIQVGSDNIRMGYKITAEPEKLGNDFIVDAQAHSGLVCFIDGKLVPSNMAIAKLINGCVKEREVGKLSNLLITIQKEGILKENSVSSNVIDACIQLGWLETAHDILDDLEAAEIPIGVNTYTSLLREYCKKNMLGEFKVLLKQMRKADLFVNMSDEDALSFCRLEDPIVNPLGKAALVGSSSLVEVLQKEIRENNSKLHKLYEFNSSILFFCKAKMMEDALATFKRMKQKNIQPTVHTFNHLVKGYSSLQMYRQITILWGELRRRLDDGDIAANRDLFEYVLWNFLRGGYFEKVMEVINYMLKHNMYTDKWKYRRIFLMFHKDLYRNLKAADARTEAQSKRLEHVRAFRKWAGIC